MGQQVLTMECSNGFTLEARDGCICILTKKKEERIPCTSIRAITVKEHGITYGKFTFTVDQQNTAGIRVGFGITAAIGAERNFFFRNSDAWKAREMRDYILECQKPAPAAAAPQTDAADQIRKLKSLLDDGILTQAEFDAKKKQILGI